MYKLVICDDEGKTTIVPLIRDELTIGRKEGNTIRLTDRNVSRGHARLTRKGAKFFIEDVGSLVGTKVNGTIIRAASVEVSPNDHIVIGEYSISIRTDVSADVPLGRQMETAEEAGIGKVTPFARLVMIQGPTLGREVELTADLYVIGRSDEANCRIDDPSISRAHARIDLEGSHWTISDLDSVNGISVNGLPKDDYVLKAGDVIEMGSVRLRFVAPGEPYEYLPAYSVEGTAPVAEAPFRPPWLLYVLGGIALVAGIAIALALKTLPSHSAETTGLEMTDSPLDKGSDRRTVDDLVQAGKDKMRSEEWGEAAGLFALALQQEPDSKVASEFKNISITESDAQSAHSESLDAARNKDWSKALSASERIPRSSRYYSEDRLQSFSEQLCLDQQKKARAFILQGAYGSADEVLKRMEGLKYAPRSCTDSQKVLVDELRNARAATTSAPQTGGAARSAAANPSPAVRQASAPSKPPASDPGSGVPTAFTGSGNPYRQEEGDGPGASGGDPVGEARAALQRGDTRGAIRILEQGGNSRTVLALLASLYRQIGDEANYRIVAQKFLKLYPTDPKASQFKRDLGL